MAAGLGFKTFTTGEVLTAADVNGYLMQGILVFASEAARDAAITSPQEGQFAFTKDNNSLWYYTGSAWAASGATGDIEGVTAGIGISGGGTSGTVTITNSMATAIDAKGDLVAGTGADTFARLAVGANNTVLTADSSTATGLKWATPSSGGMTLLNSGGTALSGTSTTISSISGSYEQLFVRVQGLKIQTNTGFIYATVNSVTDYATTLMNAPATTATEGSDAYGNIRFSASYQTGTVWENDIALTIDNYANTSFFKPFSYYGVYRSHTAGAWYGITGAGAIRTAGAITSVTIGTSSAGGFSGGTVFIYGVK